MPTKLNVYIARCGCASRRKADLLIKEGKVTVNGVVTREPWTAVSGGDTVRVGEMKIEAEKHVYVLFNKPYGVTSTVEDRHAARKIVDMVPRDMGRLYPVGRLDKMSRGLIILTNDGELCQKLTHPAHGVEKEYIVVVKGAVKCADTDKMRRGIHEKGDFLTVTSAAVMSSDAKRSTVRVVVCEGKKRHIRRLFAAFGYPVLDLRRVRIGALQLGTLKEGDFKLVDRDTVYRKTLQGGR